MMHDVIDICSIDFLVLTDEISDGWFLLLTLIVSFCVVFIFISFVSGSTSD